MSPDEVDIAGEVTDGWLPLTRLEGETKEAGEGS